MKSAQPKVISASRREEMVGFASQRLIETLSAKCPPDRVHTLVLWTKHPLPLVQNQALRKSISRYEQIFIHFSVTGMGGTPLEPGIPDWRNCLDTLPDLIRLVKDPRRIAFRFDPIVHFRLPDGTCYSNLGDLGTIASEIRKHGIQRMITSWMTPYPKVMRRLEKMGITPMEVSCIAWKKEYENIRDLSDKMNMQLSGCCVPDMKESACIDGGLFSELHPRQLPASTEKAGGQRPHCGCTQSWDIGWYHPCPGGCVYCYANPVLRTQETDIRNWHPNRI